MQENLQKQVMAAIVFLSLFVPIAHGQPAHQESITSQLLEDKAISSVKDLPQFKVNIKYPKLIAGDKKDLPVIDAVIESVVKKQISDTESQCKTIYAPAKVPSTGSELSGNYKLMLAKTDLLSIRLTFLRYFAHSAHPTSWHEVINYRLNPALALKLDDIFLPGANYLPALSAYCKKDLQFKLGDYIKQDWLDKGASAEAKNFSNFCLTDKGLLICFAEYQVAPYVCGMPEVLIPYSDLKKYLNPQLHL
jgi:hypothetical protein